MNNEPRPYRLVESQEQYRLIREIRGYLATCVGSHHGTDFEGRLHALDALTEIILGKYEISFKASP